MPFSMVFWPRGTLGLFMAKWFSRESGSRGVVGEVSSNVSDQEGGDQKSTTAYVARGEN